MADSVTLNPATKFLFFSLLKAKKQYKDFKRELGSKIESVTIVVTEKKMFLRAKSEHGVEMDKPFTEKELISFTKALGVKEEDRKNLKVVMLYLGMEKREIRYKQESKDGSKREFVL